MRSSPTRVALASAAGVLALGLAACGSSNDNGSSNNNSSSGSPAPSTSKIGAAGTPQPGQKPGGTMKVLAAEAFQHLDPGTAYFQLDYAVVFAAHRGLYYYKPQDSSKAVPDLATGPPEISPDGKTLTIKIKKGIKYGTNSKESITGQEVKAADFKYAIERAFNPHVANGYTTYFPLVGSKGAKGGPISGITTPDDYTLVLKLTTPTAATTAKALALPIGVPTPKSYVEPFDKKNPDGYDADPTKQAFTGPYMYQQYTPSKSLTLVRNPMWQKSTDFRPAYVNKFVFQLNVDPNVAAQQVRNGTNIMQLDTPAQSAIKPFATKSPQQITFSPLGNRWVSLNYGKAPFNNVNVRKAAAAILDRTAMQKVRGGAVTGDVATHFLPPGIAGFDQAGGIKGPGADYLANPNGDAAVAAKYMKAAGFKSGKAPGTQIEMVGDNSSPAKEDALIVQNSMEKLGFKVKPVLVEHDVFYSKYCQQEAQLKKIDICANFGWLPDFSDPYAMLNVNFNGEAIQPVNGNNPSLFNDKTINAAMDKAATLNDPTQRANAWGQVDRQLVAQVAAIPWFWDKQAGIVGKNVVPVIAKWNADYDLPFMSIK